MTHFSNGIKELRDIVEKKGPQEADQHPVKEKCLKELSSAMSPNNPTNIKVYYTSVSGSREVKKRQFEVTHILDANQVKYELVDISISENLLQEMRQKAGNPCAIPPQIFNGDDYCGVRENV
ncbi:hypothetical protein NDU88_002572 [Pleurodeles waltl]|uniref:Uncharacterized protein n=1 Tax=Pleurodeles waltl TaxID=8319 RepID=A0AAV7VBN2_PLEWA|nr:hypothetical protein NDU88_002572 [Pleurodeles waltl]